MKFESTLLAVGKENNSLNDSKEVFMNQDRILYAVLIMLIAFLFLFGCQLNEFDSGDQSVLKTISSATSDSLTSFNSGMWHKADWNNGSPFGCAWNPNNISFSGNGMSITLNNTARNGRAYSGGEYRTNDTFNYGTFTVSMSTFTASGTVQSFFLYTGSPWDEIDVEKIGTKGWQYNYYKNGQGGHEFIGNGSTTIVWASNYITYGGRTINGSSSTLPSHPMQVMMNVWNHDGSVNGWLGNWNYSGPLTTTYRNFNYTPLSGGGGGGGGTPGNFQLNAWQCNSSSGVTIWNGGVGSFDSGDWIMFSNVNLSTGYNNFSIEYATTLNGSLEVRLDSTGGTVIGTINYSSTGSWSTYKWTGCNMDRNVAKGTHNLYIRGKSGAANLARITINNY
jgi:endo-1,3-1,4-beta-glycanase ExoK